MYKKIFRANCLVAVTAILLCSALIVTVLYYYFENRTVEELSQIASAVADEIHVSGEGSLTDLVVGNKRVTLIEKDGTVVYDNWADPSTMENHFDRPEVQEALRGGAGLDSRDSETLVEKTLYYAILLENGSILRLATTDFTVFALLTSLLGPVLLCGVITMVLSSLLAANFSHGIVRPLHEMDLDHVEADSSYEEVTPLLKKIMRQKATIEEQLLREGQQQEEFRLITENMKEGFLVIDEEANLVTFNDAALHLLGANEPPKKGNVLQLNHSADFCQLVEKIRNGGHGDCIVECEGRICQVMANPVMGNGRVIGGAMVILDITDEMQQEKLRREFTANVSHELKTPLTSISGFAELMKDGSVPKEDVMDFSTTIYDEAQRLISLVNDILKLSALDEGGTMEDWTSVDLFKLATTTLNRLKPMADRGQVTLTLHGESTVVQGVQKILDEMIYNICDNAIKYNKPGGQVDVTITDGDAVTLTVKDTGIGIPSAHQSRIFERFYRVDKSHSREIGGTGLGLSIVKHGAALHHAAIRVDSTVDVGTSMVLTFPKKQDS